MNHCSKEFWLKKHKFLIKAAWLNVYQLNGIQEIWIQLLICPTYYIINQK